jgi:sigma-B regulation protein RsbU (phosphoserine phosphatase)
MIGATSHPGVEGCMNQHHKAAGLSPDDKAIRSIMIVDDSRLQRRILKSLLTRWGMEVVEAESGEAALNILGTRHIDLVLSDWMMSGITGVELCRRMRGQARDGYIYFVLLTSKSEQDAVTEGLVAGADDYLIKPVNSDELRARIMAADRIIRIERELKESNRLAQNTVAELRKLYDAVDRDLIEARKLQQSLVPSRPVTLPRAALSFLFQPSGHVGGDLVGRIPISEQRFGLYALDVSGHGVASAMITARLAATLASASPDQNLALEQRGKGVALRCPAETCARLNDQFLREMETEHYFTLLMADVDLARGRVRFAQAGHPNPLVQGADGRVRFVGGGGLPIGLIEGACYDICELELAAGDRMFLYSDGVTECPEPGGGMLDEDGLKRLFQEAADLRGETCLNFLSWKLNDLLDGAGLPDDVSGVLLEML